MNRFNSILAFAAVLSLCLCTFTAGAQTTRPAGFGYVGSELLSIEDLEGALPLLASYKVALVLDWPSSQLTSSARYDFVKTAAARGVEVRPWLLLPEAQGLWANSANAAQYDEQARALIDAWINAGLKPTTLVVDMEMPLDRARRFAEFVTASDSNGAIAYLRSNINRTQYTNATNIYRALVDYAHKRGFKVELSTWTQVLDDYIDGDDGLRQGFNIPIASIAWDTITFQAYRTLNDALLNGTALKTTSYYVFDYASRARAQFGTRGAVILGMTDPGDLAPDAPVYASGSQVREDLDAAAWAGIPRANVGLYNLRGILRRAPSSQWFPTTSPLSLPPLPDLATLFVRLNVAQLDASL